MPDKDEIMNILSLLAGAAQAGAQGVLAQAAYNLMKASEAKAKAQQLQNPSMQARAEDLVEETRRVFLELANNPDAVEEGKQDVAAANSISYNPKK